VAGTIAGNQVGIAPNAKILLGKIFSASGSAEDSGLLAAMQWAFDPDGDPSTNDFPNVVSNSWGGDIPDAINDVAEIMPFELAITAWIHGGIVPVFAAGNSGGTPNGFPGGLPEPIAVGALAPNDDIAEFSSRGPNLWKIGESVITLLKPDITAPGAKIASAYPGNKYAMMDGTSMATPHVSGAVALLLQANPKLKFADVKRLLLQTSDKKLDTKFGYGVINVYYLVKAGLASRSN
jgi:subtilisin family serine protease